MPNENDIHDAPREALFATSVGVIFFLVTELGLGVHLRVASLDVARGACARQAFCKQDAQSIVASAVQRVCTQTQLPFISIQALCTDIHNMISLPFQSRFELALQLSDLLVLRLHHQYALEHQCL